TSGRKAGRGKYACASKFVGMGCSSWLTSMVGRSFFFQAEDGIRDRTVTGVQTCALPIFTLRNDGSDFRKVSPLGLVPTLRTDDEIGRASCRERVELPAGGVAGRG